MPYCFCIIAVIAHLIIKLLKRLTITGSTLRSRPLEFKHQVAMEVYNRVWPLIESGKLSPLIHATVAMMEVIDE